MWRGVISICAGQTACYRVFGRHRYAPQRLRQTGHQSSSRVNRVRGAFLVGGVERINESQLMAVRHHRAAQEALTLADYRLA